MMPYEASVLATETKRVIQDLVCQLRRTAERIYYADCANAEREAEAAADLLDAIDGSIQQLRDYQRIARAVLAQEDTPTRAEWASVGVANPLPDGTGEP